jgi:uncharacterized protein
MTIDNHSLNNEFPLHRDRIHQLKLNNHHFARLANEYHEIDKEIHNIEQDFKTSDAYLEDLKKKRLSLKDEIYKLIQIAS